MIFSSDISLWLEILLGGAGALDGNQPISLYLASSRYHKGESTSFS